MHVHTCQRTYLDGDEIGLAFVGNGLGKESLTTAGRSVEQNPLGRCHSELKELLRVFHRILCTYTVCVLSNEEGIKYTQQQIITCTHKYILRIINMQKGQTPRKFHDKTRDICRELPHSKLLI